MSVTVRRCGIERAGFYPLLRSLELPATATPTWRPGLPGHSSIYHKRILTRQPDKSPVEWDRNSPSPELQLSRSGFVMPSPGSIRITLIISRHDGYCGPGYARVAESHIHHKPSNGAVCGWALLRRVVSIDRQVFQVLPAGILGNDSHADGPDHGLRWCSAEPERTGNGPWRFAISDTDAHQDHGHIG